MSPSGDRRGHGAVTAGFTLIELLVVMGLLSGFLMMLVQLVDSGVRMFREGELAQAIADRGSHAQRVLTDELVLLRGPGSLRDRDVVDDRLVVQVLPIGLPVRPDATTARGSVVRAAVHLSPEREQSLIDLRITARLLAEEPTLAGEALDQRVRVGRERSGRQPIGDDEVQQRKHHERAREHGEHGELGTQHAPEHVGTTHRLVPQVVDEETGEEASGEQQPDERDRKDDEQHPATIAEATGLAGSAW